ncbi:MAG: helix-turn-helix transcriptional regulator, partial [Myxococcales bacterium]|nr:helix-turn-helix transcriptional regulator [Myxococcales bacterium]
MTVSPDKKARTRAQILEAAARLFRERGYAGVSVQDVMAAAGLTVGGFYAHFPSKEALYAEAFAHALDERSAFYRAAPPELTGREWLNLAVQ